MSRTKDATQGVIDHTMSTGGESKFLSLLAMVVLTVFLREKGSQESKSLATPHHMNEE